MPETLLVLDIDPRNGGSYRALVDVLGPLPATLTVWSGRGDGGRHLYFLRPHGELSSQLLPPGVDLKKSGYCIVPPSVHPATGQPYVWDESNVFAALPPAAAAALRQKPRLRLVTTHSANPDSLLGALLGVMDRYPTQGINNALYWCARRAAENGVDLDDALVERAVLHGESERQARATVLSARRKTTGGAA